MNIRKSIILTFFFIAVILTGIYLVSCTNQSSKGMIIFARVPVDNFNQNSENIYHNFPGSSLMIINPSKSGGSEINLTPDFYSACFPQISYNAKRLLFAGQKNENDPWQVWEMDLKKKESRKVTDFKEPCFTPAYLPGEKLVFSREMADTGTGPSRALFTMNLDGSNLHQITFHPHINYVETILRDGRILMLSKRIFPKTGEIKSLAIRPNGTKAEIFYKAIKGSITGVRMRETGKGLIYFTEQDTGELKKRDIVSIHQNRPLHSKVNYTADIAGSFYSVLPVSSKKLVVSFCSSGDQTIGLYTFNVDEKSVGESLLSDPEYHFLDPVLVEPYERPRNLPIKELNLSYPTGLIMCQDINLTDLTGNNGDSISKATKIEILGMDENFGIVPVEKDGSFFLKVIADLPFRIRTLDNNNKVISGPSDWIWVRPFERRGCVGCHEDHELAPQNIVPLAVNKWPVLIPVDTIDSFEKRKTLELGDMHE